MTDYATINELREYLPDITASADVATLQRIITRASRVIDHYIDPHRTDIFAKNVDNTVSTRSFYGNGTDRLLIGPHIEGSVTTITLPSGFTAVGSNYIEQGEELVRTVSNRIVPINVSYLYDYPYQVPVDGVIPLSLINWYGWTGGLTGWPWGVKVEVTAKFGLASIPEDITEACLEIAVWMWSNKRQQPTPGLLGNNPQDVRYDRDIPDTAKAILKSYQRKQPLVFS